MSYTPIIQFAMANLIGYRREVSDMHPDYDPKNPYKELPEFIPEPDMAKAVMFSVEGRKSLVEILNVDLGPNAEPWHERLRNNDAYRFEMGGIIIGSFSTGSSSSYISSVVEKELLSARLKAVNRLASIVWNCAKYRKHE